MSRLTIPSTLLMLVLLVTTAPFIIARAADEAETGYWDVSGPIAAEYCSIVGPHPPLTSCDTVQQPTNAIFPNLPWDEEPYKTCVITRCGCTQAANTAAPSYEPNGLYCQPDKTWEESGYVYCDDMTGCFSSFWHCVANGVWAKYTSNGLDSLSTAEQAYVNDIITHGTTLGQSFTDTDTYKSCAAIQCAASAGRKNCGLTTCLMDNSVCVEYIKPPPLPYKPYTCTVACRAALLMMAFTAAAFFFSMSCCCCCPPKTKQMKPVVEVEPVKSPAVVSSSDNDEAAAAE